MSNRPQTEKPDDRIAQIRTRLQQAKTHIMVLDAAGCSYSGKPAYWADIADPIIDEVLDQLVQLQQERDEALAREARRDADFEQVLQERDELNAKVGEAYWRGFQQATYHKPGCLSTADALIAVTKERDTLLARRQGQERT